MPWTLVVVHWPKGFCNTNGGIEFTPVLVGASIGLALTGFGAWSADALLGLSYPDWLLVGRATVMFGRSGRGIGHPKVIVRRHRRSLSASPAASDRLGGDQCLAATAAQAAADSVGQQPDSDQQDTFHQQGRPELDLRFEIPAIQIGQSDQYAQGAGI